EERAARQGRGRGPRGRAPGGAGRGGGGRGGYSRWSTPPTTRAPRAGRSSSPPRSRHRRPPTAGAASARCSGRSEAVVRMKSGERRTQSAPSPLVGEGWGGGSAGDAPAVPHTTTPPPNPSPPGGREHTERRGG